MVKGIRHVDLALGVLATAWLAWRIARFPSWTVDDAFIVSRYADNLVSHGELAFNAGAGAADRVEGFTSPLAMLLAIVVRAVGADPIAATKAVCVGAALAMPALVVALGRAVHASRLASGIAALLFAMFPEHAMHAGSGLETELFAAVSLGLLVAFARLLARDARPRSFVILSILTALGRPEGIAMVLVLSAILVALRQGSERMSLARTLLLGTLLPLALFEAFRFFYYGSLLPNTFYAKRGGWNGAHAGDLEALFDVVVVDIGLLALAGFVLARIVRGRAPRVPPRLVAIGVASCLLLVMELFVYARSEPIMDYGRRFAWHGAAPLAACMLALFEMVQRAANALRLRREALFGLALVASYSSERRTEPAAGRNEAYATRQQASVQPLHVPTIRWVRENTSPDALIAVYPDAGRLPFETHRRTVDFGKLNDRVLARAQGDAAVIRYFFERRPDAVIFGRKASGLLFDSGAEALVHDARFLEEYTLAERVFGDREEEGDGYLIYRRATP